MTSRKTTCLLERGTLQRKRFW